MGCSYHAAPLSVFRSWDGSIFNNENWHADSDFAHEDNESRRAHKPKWGDGDISLVLNCVSRQYSCIPFGTRARYKLSLPVRSHISRWNVRTRPPIRTSDIPSWTYDENTYSENPARSEGPWIKSNTDFAIINKLSGWKWWCNEQTGHLASFGVVFWKVDFITSLSITVPSSETLLVTCHSRCHILAVECMIIRLNFMM